MARAARASLSFSACLAACVKEGAEHAPCVAAAARAILRIAMVNPFAPSMPNRALYTPDRFNNVSLVSLRPDGQANPALAKAWRTDDRQIWTFTLHDNLCTQDGRARQHPYCATSF